jgi:flagellar biosynthesis anti-sigma factor FlgM
MKVNGPSRPTPTYQSRGIPRDDGDDARPASPGERVRLSGQAQAIADARAPESADAAKVARLRDSIQNGSFKIDLDRIVDAMLREES